MIGPVFSKRGRSILLLALVCIMVFILPLTPCQGQRYLFNAGFTVIMAAAVASMDTWRRFFIIFALSSIVVAWVSEFLDIDLLATVARAATFLFFIVVVIGLISQIARSRQVTLRVILEATTGYLLLGLVFALICMIISGADPSAFSFPHVMDDCAGNRRNVQDAIYFAFVTFTTLGFGDMLPLTPLARTVAILAAVTGQLYLTVIIAMLVGKFLNTVWRDTRS